MRRVLQPLGQGGTRLLRSSLLFVAVISADQILSGEINGHSLIKSVGAAGQIGETVSVENSNNQFEEFLEARQLQEKVTAEEKKELNKDDLPEDVRSLTSYPEPLMTNDQVKKGGFLLYIMGIMYAFLGISLATQDYINPSIDIIKKKGVLSSESMNATLLAMTNSAAESFIIMNSIFFGVSDIGISTVVQQAAFYSFVVQSVFYLIVPVGTFIDWWIITRETVFILLYLIVLSVFLYGNRVEVYKALILLVLYIVHIFLMKFSSKYEVAIKTALANRLEIKTLQKLADEDITRFHMNLKSNAISIEMLNKVHFTLRGDYIVFKDSLIRKKLRLSNSIKSGEEKYADKSDKTLMARKMWKEAVSMIIIKLQAYKHNQQIQRTQQCRQRLDKMLPLIDSKDIKEMEDEDKIFGESYDSEEEEYEEQTISDADQPSDINIQQYGSEQEDEMGESNARNHVQILNGASSVDQNEGIQTEKLLKNLHKSTSKEAIANAEADVFNLHGSTSSLAFDQEIKKKYEQFIEHQPAQQLPPSHIYEIIMKRFYSGESKIAWPETAGRKVLYILLMPLTHLQAISIPNPMRGKNAERENLYPITLFMSMVWIWFYSFIIVWFTFDLTVAFGWHFNVLPMMLYPFGIALRDYKKKVNLEQAIVTFNQKIKEQQMSLAETFSGPIFQITGLMGLAWTLYIGLKGNDYVSFINESIQFQMPMLVVVVVVKYVILACSRYKTSRRLFYVNIACYFIFVGVIALIDYRIQLFGE